MCLELFNFITNFVSHNNFSKPSFSELSVLALNFPNLAVLRTLFTKIHTLQLQIALALTSTVDTLFFAEPITPRAIHYRRLILHLARAFLSDTSDTRNLHTCTYT